MQHSLAVQVARAVGSPGSAVLIFVPGMASILAIMDLFELISSADVTYKVGLLGLVGWLGRWSSFRRANEGHRFVLRDVSSGGVVDEVRSETPTRKSPQRTREREREIRLSVMEERKQQHPETLLDVVCG